MTPETQRGARPWRKWPVDFFPRVPSNTPFERSGGGEGVRVILQFVKTWICAPDLFSVPALDSTQSNGCLANTAFYWWLGFHKQSMSGIVWWWRAQTLRFEAKFEFGSQILVLPLTTWLWTRFKSSMVSIFSTVIRDNLKTYLIGTLWWLMGYCLLGT